MSEPSRDHETTPSARHFTRVLESVDPATSSADGMLRDAICDFVRDLKAEGAPPERVLVTVKDVIAAADSGRDTEQQRRFVQQVITWCIEAYYGLN